MSSHTLENVFGTSRRIPLSYTHRQEVDDIFLSSLKQNKHIIIYGSSKQGKTCLRKKHINNSDYISIVCTDTQTITDLNQRILRQAGYELIISESVATAGKVSGSIEGGFKLFVKLQSKLTIEGDTKKTIETKPLDIDLSDINDVISALEAINFNKLILIEEFHYLKPETQKDFANNLKTYYDNSNIVFVITGVWVDENKLITLNGDLASRVVTINVDLWKPEYLREVIESGCSLLNIRFSDSLIEDIILESFDNVYFVQEICYRICSNYKIQKTVALNDPTILITEFTDRNGEIIELKEPIDNRFLINEIRNLSDISKGIVDQHSGRYNKFLVQLVSWPNNNYPQIPKFIAYYLLIASVTELQIGMNVVDILRYINTEMSDKDLISESNLIEILNSVTEFQFSKEIRPVIIDFDYGIKKLYIVDREFTIWLEFQNKKEIRSLLEKSI